MTLEQAFKDLISNWAILPKKFRDKYRSYKSKYLSGKHTEVGEKKKREILLTAGYEEYWFKKPKN